MDDAQRRKLIERILEEPEDQDEILIPGKLYRFSSGEYMMYIGQFTEDKEKGSVWDKFLFKDKIIKIQVGLKNWIA